MESLLIDSSVDLPKKKKTTKDTFYLTSRGDIYLGAKQQVTELKAGAYAVRYTPFSSDILFVPKDIKCDDVIDLNSDVVNKIREELDNLDNSREKFKQYGLVFKRGILVHGDPGNGKTSLINKTVLDYTKKGYFSIYMNDSSINAIKPSIDAINKFFPDTNILVVVEDLDSKMQIEEFLLSFFDGENQCNNIVVLATTNHKSKLSRRLLRPSRFDTQLEFKAPSTENRKLYLNHKLMGNDLKYINEMVTSTNGFSMAELKEVLIGVTCLGKDLDEVVSDIKRNKIGG